MGSSEAAPAAGKVSTTARERAEKKDPFYVFRRWCKSCGLCVAFCPRQVLEAGPDGRARVVDAERCTRCRLCEALCPDFAITVAKKEK